MKLTIRHTWPMTYDFACQSKACAPPPVGAGGSLKGSGRALTKLQQHHLESVVKATARGSVAPVTQAEAKGLLSRGLIERVSGKGQGFGNSPVWKATKAGTDLVNGPAPKIEGKPLPKAIRLGGGSKERLVVGETETHYLMGGYRIAKADLKPEHIIQ